MPGQRLILDMNVPIAASRSKTGASLEERGKRASREKFEAALARLPDVEPEEHDKL